MKRLLAAAVYFRFRFSTLKVKNIKFKIMKNTILHPVENLTIEEISEIIKKHSAVRFISDEEFSKMILSRRPMELLLMAYSIFSSLDSA